MIPTIRIADSDYFGRPPSAFRRGGCSRPLEVWVDNDSLTESADLEHLLGFAEHPDIAMTTTTPTAGAETAELVMHGNGSGVRIRRTDGETLTGGGPVDTYQSMSAAWAEENPGSDPELLLTSALLASVADNDPADVFVTGAAPLWEHMGRANAMSVTGALALLGLFLRSTDDFTVQLGPDPVRYNRGLFYRVLASELVPSWGPTWRRAAPAMEGPERFLNGLGHGLMMRVNQALRARDNVQIELKLTQSNDSADESLLAFDSLLVCLDACFDVMSLTLNWLYALAGNENSVRWRSDQWSKKLQAAAPALDPIVGPGGVAADAVKLIGALRKALHRAPLQTIAHSSGSFREVTNLLAIPVEQDAAVTDVTDRNGGASSWGRHPPLEGLSLYHLGPLVENLTRLALTAVESVVSSAIGPAGVRDTHGAWGDTPKVRARVRALAGTSDW